MLRVYNPFGDGDTVQDLAKIAAGENPVNVRLAFQKKERADLDNNVELVDSPEEGVFIGCDTPLEAGKVLVPGLSQYLKDRHLSSENDQFTSEELNMLSRVSSLAAAFRLFYEGTACLYNKKESSRLMDKIQSVLKKQETRERLRPLVDKMDDQTLDRMDSDIEPDILSGYEQQLRH